jgi:futalosine hydrolase
MRLLLVAATSFEVEPIVRHCAGPIVSGSHTRFRHRTLDIDVLITGVGMVATAFWCGKRLSDLQPDLAVNIGVAGTFNPDFPPGTVVNVVSDRFPELGAEDGETLLSIEELGLLDANAPPFRAGRLENVTPPTAFASLPRVHGVTVNTVHGHDPSIARIVQRWSPDVESMEGAAFMYACLTEGVAFAQIRAISNRVERRNRAGWQLAQAITNLATEVTAAIDSL